MNIKIDHTQVRDAADVLEALAFNGDEHNFGDVPTDKVRYTAANLRAIANEMVRTAREVAAVENGAKALDDVTFNDRPDHRTATEYAIIHALIEAYPAITPILAGEENQ